EFGETIGACLSLQERLTAAGMALPMWMMADIDHGDVTSADPDELQIGIIGKIEDLFDGTLRLQHFAVLGGIGEKGNRHDIGMGAGLFGDAMHH
ncbi:hypothetical protein AB9F40_33795, partial [Rhizobium leguminosarum]